MRWRQLEETIKTQCKRSRKSNMYTQALLDYCENLYDQDLPIITTPYHLSQLIGIEFSYLCKMAYSPVSFYRSFQISKKNGKSREIDEPLPDLKFVQRWILTNILEKVHLSIYAKAYVKGVTLRHNARFHQNKDVVVTMDIKDFFPSISIGSIVTIFEKIGYLHDVSCFLAYLCCLDGKLPQGAPTSPYLSNLRMKSLDERIGNYVYHKGIMFTRYADDLTFSGSMNPHELIKKISHYVWEDGFSLNASKTRVARRNTRQEVTGIVVNSRMQISRTKRKYIRQQMYYIDKYGIESHLQWIKESRSHYINHLIGLVNFALFVNPRDQEMQKYYKRLVDML